MERNNLDWLPYLLSLLLLFFWVGDWIQGSTHTRHVFTVELYSHPERLCFLLKAVCAVCGGGLGWGQAYSMNRALRREESSPETQNSFWNFIKETEDPVPLVLEPKESKEIYALWEKCVDSKHFLKKSENPLNSCNLRNRNRLSLLLFIQARYISDGVTAHHKKTTKEAVCMAPSVLSGRWEGRSDLKMGLRAGKFVSSWENSKKLCCFSSGEKGQICWRIKWKLICKCSVASGFRSGLDRRLPLEHRISLNSSDYPRTHYVDHRLTSNSQSSCLGLLECWS